MAIERTFSIIKPNAVAKNVIGNIFARFEAAGFKIVGTKMLHLTVEQARGFYAEHDGKPFFDGLRVKTPFSVTAICWARPIRQTHWPVLCVLITLTA